MSQHADILEQQESSLRGPLVGSLALHGGIIGFLLVFAWWTNRNKFTMGDPNAMGGAVGITPVSSIPLPHRPGIQNPVANDSKSQVPTPPKAVEKAAPKEEPDAIPLSSKQRQKRQAEIIAKTQRYRSTPDRPNQVYSDAGQSAQSPMFTGQPGAGGVGIGPNSVFGSQFGAYANLIIRQVANRWGMATANLPPQLRTSRRVIVRFSIQGDGTVTSPVILDRSGVPEVDYAAQRAILNASPFPRLPAGFPTPSATVELTFEIQR